MYYRSSQMKYWRFDNEAKLTDLRTKANQKFIENAGSGPKLDFLTAQEEFHLCRHYEFMLRDFCRKFQPPMPRCVMGTAFHYFKRFYLRNSVMDYHPQEILLTCVYLAAKVEEFNVSIIQFVSNVKLDQTKTTNIVLNNELLLMQQLNYHLTIHNPFRPVEGFFIDIKTKCPSIRNVENLRPAVDEFLDHSFLTDVCLLYSSSQIALAAIFHAASKFQENLDTYISERLFNGQTQEKRTKVFEIISNIRKAVKTIENSHHGSVKNIEKKLAKCRNEENNPESNKYKRKMDELFEEEEGRSSRKYARIAQEQERVEQELLGKADKHNFGDY